MILVHGDASDPDQLSEDLENTFLLDGQNGLWSKLPLADTKPVLQYVQTTVHDVHSTLSGHFMNQFELWALQNKFQAVSLF